EQRTKPIRMLVVNCHRSWPHGFNSERKFPSAVEVTEASRDFYQGEQARISDPRRSLENHHWKWRSQNLGPFAIALTVRLFLLFITYRRLRTCPGRHRICSCGSACKSNSSYPYIEISVRSPDQHPSGTPDRVDAHPLRYVPRRKPDLNLGPSSLAPGIPIGKQFCWRFRGRNSVPPRAATDRCQRKGHPKWRDCRSRRIWLRA